MPRFLTLCLLALLPASAKSIPFWGGSAFYPDYEPVPACEICDGIDTNHDGLDYGLSLWLCQDTNGDLIVDWVYEEVFDMCDLLWVDLYDQHLEEGWVDDCDELTIWAIKEEAFYPSPWMVNSADGPMIFL